jgi:hypothetical protein
LPFIVAVIDITEYHRKTRERNVKEISELMYIDGIELTIKFMTDDGFYMTEYHRAGIFNIPS